MTLVDLSTLQTEGRNKRTVSNDRVSTQDLCRLINNEDESVAHLVVKCIPVIAGTIDAVAPRIREGGGLIYVGVGTSGRLRIVDGSEMPPTFSAPHGQFVTHMAEGAEDNVESDLSSLSLKSELDSLIGIAALGRTPYVLDAMEYAKNLKLGCITIGLACSEPSAMSTTEGLDDCMISAVMGPEVVTRSTRIKVGMAAKSVLNTGIMIMGAPRKPRKPHKDAKSANIYHEMNCLNTTTLSDGHGKKKRYLAAIISAVKPSAPHLMPLTT